MDKVRNLLAEGKWMRDKLSGLAAALLAAAGAAPT